jgi:YVTN family beta-propeller protein
MASLKLWSCIAAPFLILPLLWSGAVGDAPPAKEPTPIRLRRPVALCLADEGRKLLVANRDSGTVSVIDTQALRVLSETRVGRKLSDMASDRKGERILVADEEAGAILVLAFRDGALHEQRRLKAGPTPVSVQLRDGRLASVACLWPRRVLLFDLNGDQESPVAIDLPFAPRTQLPLPGERLLVADSFGDRLAVIDLRGKKLESVRSLEGAHNIRGVALDRSGRDVLVAHQTLSSQGRPTPDDIRSARLLSNDLHRVPLANLLEPSASLMRNDRVYSLGDVERGAGDPAGLAEGDGGQVAVALAGTNELAIGWPEKATWARVAVGARPTAVVLDAARRRAFVANTFGDSVGVVDVQALARRAEIPLGEPVRELSPEERGEVLFYDARLSFEAWFSCHSCHTDGHTSGRLNDNFTDGSFGTPKRVLSLLGVADTRPWAWNGKMPDLESQVRQSLKSTMQNRAPTEQQARDLSAYLKTLAPPPALARARDAVDAEAVKRGQVVFENHKCAACHAPPTYTSPAVYDVGLRDEKGENHFNPPSLRGLSQAGPYFHDNRAATLEAVFTQHRHRLNEPLSERELRDLLAFLGSL